MRMTVPLGPKIFTDIVVCEGCGSEVTVWTDGQRAYAQCGGSGMFFSPESFREREKLSVRCGYTNINTDEVCGTLVEFDLTEPAWLGWVETTPEILSMMEHAEKIEVES